jgi:hypothetical protein
MGAMVIEVSILSAIVGLMYTLYSVGRGER